MAEPKVRLLIVDDEVAQLRALCDTLEFQGYATAGYVSAQRALTALEQEEFDVVLTDLKMPEMDGVALLAAAQRIDPDVVGIIMTGHGTVDTAVDAMRAGSIDYVLKPFKLSAIMAVLTRALAVRRLRTENLELKETVSIYGLSMSLASVLNSKLVPERVADAAMQLPNAVGACVLVGGARAELLRVATCRGSLQTHANTSPIAIDAALTDWAANSQHDLTSIEAQSATSATNHPLRTRIPGIAIPMLSGGALMGVLCFATAQTRRPVRTGQLKALKILASTAAAAMDAALLVQEMENRVAERTEELRAANEELDSFSRSISHDLRAPLRAIEGYYSMIIDEHAAELTAETQRLLRQAHASTERMRSLIDDLLSFARFAREPLTRQNVDMRELALSTMQELLAAAPAKRIEIQIPQLEPCIGDPSLLRQVLTNLLANAIKFSQHRELPRIEVGCQEDLEEIVYFVRDNGAGFDMKYADRLFGVFERLHDSSQFEGTGVGLSIVRRIIARHGGRTWAEGARDAGATFYFSLPKEVS
jgi:signal transduction histidine kinase/CheY-like chemotaxis protein